MRFYLRNFRLTKRLPERINFVSRGFTVFKRFLTEQDAKEKTIPDTSEKENYYITIPYLESESRRFINKLAKIIKNKINVNIVSVYKSFKIGIYFQ